MERANASLISPPDADAHAQTPEGLLRSILAEVKGLRDDLAKISGVGDDVVTFTPLVSGRPTKTKRVSAPSVSSAQPGTQ